MTAEPKLAELRRKTDRQLMALIERQMVRARTAGACQQIRALLPYLAKGDRLRMEERLDALMEELRPGVQTTCC